MQLCISLYASQECTGDGSATYLHNLNVSHSHPENVQFLILQKCTITHICTICEMYFTKLCLMLIKTNKR